MSAGPGGWGQQPGRDDSGVAPPPPAAPGDGYPPPPPPVERRRGPGIGTFVSTIAAVLVILGLGTVVWKVESAERPAIRAIGAPVPRAEMPGGGTPGAEMPAPLENTWTDPTRPPPKVESATPLGTPAPAPAGTGPYAFVAERLDGRPVAYDPCRTIRYVVNPQEQPFQGDRTLGLSILRVSGLTGLRFEQVGTTDETDPGERSPYQPERYGQQWAPVLIWWATPEQAPHLEGDVVGYASSTSYEWMGDSGMSRMFVSGVVVLDGPDLAQMIIRGRRGEEVARAIVMHEIGHLVGLDHVDDRAQLMYPEANPEVLDFAPGDILGLRELGVGQCFTDI